MPMPFQREKLEQALTSAGTTYQAALKSALTAYGWDPANYSTYDTAVQNADKAYQKSVLLARLLFSGENILIDRAAYTRLSLATDPTFSKVAIFG